MPVFRKSLGRIILLGFCLLLFIGCYRPCSPEYQEFYHHLNQQHQSLESAKMHESDYFVVLLVDARHLDYTDNRSFFNTVAKHPSDGSKNGDIGHAWIYLQGYRNGQKVQIELGHSGERGLLQAKYFDGIMNYLDYGYANPTPEQRLCPRYEPNPVKYLWTTQQDGFFQKGAGGHRPTFAAKVDLTSEQFDRIWTFVHREYPFRQYALTQHQCSSFVVHIAALAGLSLEAQVSMKIEPGLYYRGVWIRLWEDPKYSTLIFSSPDILEKSLMQAVYQDKAEYALNWYLLKFN